MDKEGQQVATKAASMTENGAVCVEHYAGHLTL